jgi:catechol 2,3-dioxygenase-like lactoylglutathione lyase family enzyme
LVDTLPIYGSLDHVRFAAPNLSAMQEFCENFGMVFHAKTDTTLYMRGLGANVVHVTELADKPTFLGLAFRVQSLQELERFSVKTGSPIVLATGPSGGHRVRVQDPNGYNVDVVFTTATLPPIPQRPTVRYSMSNMRTQ